MVAVQGNVITLDAAAFLPEKVPRTSREIFDLERRAYIDTRSARDSYELAFLIAALSSLSPVLGFSIETTWKAENEDIGSRAQPGAVNNWWLAVTG